MKLGSMKNFTLEQCENLRQGKITKQKYVELTERYANLLNQKVEHGMFVPCNNGDILDRPKHHDAVLNSGVGDNYIKSLEYEKAKERVIFKNWFMKDKEHLTDGVHVIDTVMWFMFINNNEHPIDCTMENLSLINPLLSKPTTEKLFK